MAQSPFTGSGLEPELFPIVVHSHLSWDWVWQRPQQFVVRLARRHPVLFVETHVTDSKLPAPRAAISKAPEPNVYILQVLFPPDRFHDGDYVDQERLRLVKEAIEVFVPQFQQPVQWFYDPMAVTAFLGKMDELAIVYDCMDELSKFAFAPPCIGERERRLLAAADVVFTGGRRLFEAKSPYNSNTHFYGCGVDVGHFAQAYGDDLRVAEDVAHLSAPRLGYIGVVDERLDYDLIDWIARERPAWQILMVGPSIKVDESVLPRRTNIHWLGGRPYERLPAYAKAFDICLMPFALNESTEFINPTKALEYMATRRPVVSTPVADVVSNFGSVAHIANGREAFLAACDHALRQQDDERLERGLQMARAQTWDQIVDQLEAHVLAAVTSRPPSVSTEGYTANSANGHKRTSGIKRLIDV